MNFGTNASAQTILVGVIAYIGNAEGIDSQMRFWATIGCCLLMAGIGLFVHRRNPDGTPAEASWERKPKKS